MPHTALGPVFTGLRTGLHVLFCTLTAIVVGRAVFAPTERTGLILSLCLLLLITYGIGALLPHVNAPKHQTLLQISWISILTCQWLVLVWLTPEAAYLIFPMFFLYLHILGGGYGSLAILLATVTTIYALGAHNGFSTGGIVGPLVGAGVALLIGLGYQALARESGRRERLMRELLATRSQLAASEHESGILAERARLAREIHDTVAQGLSSIQMLLHAAELRSPDGPGVEHIRLARVTASENLAEARRFIRELTPPALDGDDLSGALRRLASTQWNTQGLEVQVRVGDGLALPMHVQTALLRITQGALANVIQHAHATTVTITLARQDDHIRFSIADNGQGFDAENIAFDAARSGESFGLHATYERVEQLGGTLTVDSAPGVGTTIVIDLAMEEAP